MRSKRNSLAAYASGVYMGRLLNRSGDKVPPDQPLHAVVTEPMDR